MLPREKGTNKTVDWKAVLTKIKGKKPDVVFYGGMDATGGPLAQAGTRTKDERSVFAFGDGACTDKMAELAGPAAEGLLCSQAGIPVQAAGTKFLNAYKTKFKVDPILYSPFTYDAANLLIQAMKKAGSADPAKYLPVLAASNHTGASGNIQFDEKGDRKDAEMTIFTLKEGKITPVAILKGGKSLTLEEYAALTHGAGAGTCRTGEPRHPPLPGFRPGARCSRSGSTCGSRRHAGSGRRCGSRTGCSARRGSGACSRTCRSGTTRSEEVSRAATNGKSLTGGFPFLCRPPAMPFNNSCPVSRDSWKYPSSRSSNGLTTGSVYAVVALGYTMVG